MVNFLVNHSCNAYIDIMADDKNNFSHISAQRYVTPGFFRGHTH